MRRRKGKTGYFWGVLTLLSAAFLINIYSGEETQALESTDGIELLKELENEDIRMIQEEIEALQEQKKKEYAVIEVESEILDEVYEETTHEIEVYEETQPETESKTENETEEKPDIKQRFSDSIIIGDSITEGLVDYQILNSQCVLAGRGLRASQIEEHIDKAISLGPKKLFLALGLNDLEFYRGDGSRFVNIYREKIMEIKEKAPEIEIYVSGILPVQSDTMAEKTEFACIEIYNEALVKMCDELGVTYIDNSKLLDGHDEWYQKDGIHMKPDFYPAWLENMAEKAGL